MSDSPENYAPDSPPILRAGHLIGGRYRIQSLLGRGGMGVVYGAIHELTQRRVALKLVDSEGADLPGLRDRFLSEARTAAAVRHPNVVDMLDMGMHGGSPYLVMELLEGRPLDIVIKQKHPLSFEQILGWLFPIMGALVTLHEAGIVHRDIKPSNIFLSQSGRQPVVPKLLDFGLARGATDARLTRSGVVVGTPLYMAPEHAAGAHVGPPADVWSMGVVLFESLSGAVPYTSTDRSVLAAQVLAGHVRPLRQARVDVPPAIAAAIDGALQRDLGTRHASMRAFAQALAVAAVASQIPVADNPDALGLPEFLTWKGGAAYLPKPDGLGTTLELPSATRKAQTTASTSRPRSRLAYGLLALTMAIVLGVWLWRSSPSPALPASPLPEAARPPPGLPASGPAAVTSEADRAATPRDLGGGAATTSAPSPALKEGPPPLVRMPLSDPPRRKTLKVRTARPSAPELPAEVETEWK